MTWRDGLAGLGSTRIIVAVTGVLAVTAVMPIGGAPRWVTLLLAVLAPAAVAVLHLKARTGRRSLHPAALVLFGLAGLSLLQAIPLPIGLLSRLSPGAADIWSRALVGDGRTLTWGSISLDPSATLVAAARWSTYGCTFHVATLAGRMGEGRTVLRVVALTGTAVALATLAHQLVGAERVFGIYLPQNRFAAHGVGPLLNPNHLAGYLNLTALVGLGLALQPRTPVPRAVLAASVIITVAMSLRAASGGGAVGLVLGVVLLLALLGARWITKPESPGFSGPLVATGMAVVLVGGALLAWIGYDEKLAAELGSVNASKVELLRFAWPMIGDYLRTGVGRGAFETVFDAYRPPFHTSVTFTHPENLLVQWVSEWGVLGAVALACLAWWLRPTRRTLASPASMGALAGVVAIAAQNLVDFSLELPGPAVAFALVLGALVEPRRRASRRSSPRLVWLSASAPVLAIFVLIFAGPDVVDARTRARDLVTQGAPSDQIREEVGALIEQHPADYFLALMRAEAAEAAGKDPTPWLQRALERGPESARVHLLLARVLIRRGAKSQAMLELRTAAELEPVYAPLVGRLAVEWTQDLDLLLRVVPPGADGIHVFDAMRDEATRRKALALADALEARIVESFPDDAAARSRAVERLFAQLAAKSCVPESRCLEDLERHATYFLEHDPASAQGDLIRARVEVQRGDDSRAAEILRAGCRKPKGVQACLAQLAEVESPEAVGAVVDRYTDLSCGKPESCAAAYDWASGLYERRKMWAQAYGAAEKAARAAPTKPRWQRAAGLAARAGLNAEQQAAEQRAGGAH